jgi:hypothetical protein
MTKLFLKNLLFFSAIVLLGMFAQFLIWTGEFSEARDMFVQIFTYTVRFPLFVGAMIVGLATFKTWSDLRSRKSSD